MLKHMKIYTPFKNILIFAALYAVTANAGLYKGLDEEGNVIYSDKPFENSEQFTPPAISVVDAPKVPLEKEVIVEEKAAETTYTKFKITAPKNNQTIWNVPDLTVSLQLSPALNTAEGHTTWLLMDGKPLVKKSQSMLLQIGRADRGEHKLQAQVRNKKGKVIKRTKTITVHIKNTVVQRKAR
jgi:hypothetical protein